jgi:hypothetical protein
VTGAFRVKIPVSKGPAILPQERDTLAIFKWRLLQTSPANRWYPVLQRYVDLVSARVAGLGGDPGAITPSPDGAPPLTHPKPGRATTGRVLDPAAGHAPPAPRHGHDLPGRTAPHRIGERAPVTASTARPDPGEVTDEAERAGRVPG